MLTLHIARRRGVHLARFTEVVTSAELEALDKVAVEFAAHDGPVHAIMDFSCAEAIALPETKILQRGRTPQLMPGYKRIIMASTFEQQALARLFVAEQTRIGAKPPEIVSSVEAAFEWLDVAETDFEPLDWPVLQQGPAA